MKESSRRQTGSPKDREPYRASGGRKRRDQRDHSSRIESSWRDSQVSLLSVPPVELIGLPVFGKTATGKAFAGEVFSFDSKMDVLVIQEGLGRDKTSLRIIRYSTITNLSRIEQYRKHTIYGPNATLSPVDVSKLRQKEFDTLEKS